MLVSPGRNLLLIKKIPYHVPSAVRQAPLWLATGTHTLGLHAKAGPRDRKPGSDLPRNPGHRAGETPQTRRADGCRESGPRCRPGHASTRRAARRGRRPVRTAEREVARRLPAPSPSQLHPGRQELCSAGGLQARASPRPRRANLPAPSHPTPAGPLTALPTPSCVKAPTSLNTTRLPGNSEHGRPGWVRPGLPRSPHKH